MNKIKIFSLFICISLTFIFSRCTDSETKLKLQGYQVFPQQNLALKCPCKLKLDSVDIKSNKKKYRDYKSYICKTQFNKQEKIYHVQFISESKYEINEQINDIKKMLVKKGYTKFSERKIAGIKALYYNFSPFAQGVQMFHKKYGCSIIIESMECKKDLNKLLKTVKQY